MSLNIFEIWDKIGRCTPFAVRRDDWAEEHYTIVERIECEKLPYGKAFGYPTIRGELSTRYEYDKEWLAEKLIPCCGCYQWTLVENVEINNGKSIIVEKKKKIQSAYTLDSKLNFGKYKGETVEVVFLQNRQYIVWALINVEKFCLTNETINLLEALEPGYKFNEEVRKINQQKLLQI